MHHRLNATCLVPTLSQRTTYTLTLKELEMHYAIPSSLTTSLRAPATRQNRRGLAFENISSIVVTRASALTLFSKVALRT